MKKVLITLLIIVLTSGLYTLVSSEKYAEIKKLLNEQKGALETLLKADASIKDAKSAAAVLNRFTNDLGKLLPLIAEVVNKYPNVAQMFVGNPPKELKKQMDELKELGLKMSTTFNKIMQFAQDPAVQEAQKRMLKLQIEITQILNGPEEEKKA